MNRIQQRQPGRSQRPMQRAFTVIELLVVVAIIILLLSILIVAMNQVVRGAQSANTTALMSSISQALVKFKGDHGYLPPVLNDDRGIEFNFTGYSSFNGPDPTHADYATDVQDWYSITTLADYLIGYGDNSVDGYGDVSAGEVPLTGIRSPGGDGVWGATLNGDRVRNPVIQGKRFGPYLELSDENLLAGIDLNGNIVFPDEDPSFDSYAKTIVDYWGTPLRYYRPAYPTGALKHQYNRIEVINADGQTVPVPTLSDVFVLRPYDLADGATIDGLNDQQTPVGDPTSTRKLLAAEFATFSAGPDISLTPTVRVDPEEFNRDNLVEVGP